jgi:hypothetical protein
MLRTVDDHWPETTSIELSAIVGVIPVGVIP